MATVTSCTYTAGAGQALAFGIPTSKHFVIAYNYWAGGELHTGEFRSAKAIPQGQLFPITINPVAPHEHDHEQAIASARPPLVAVGIAGSVAIALAWLVFFYGCRGR